MEKEKGLLIHKLEIATHVFLISNEFPTLIKSDRGVIFKFKDTPENRDAIEFHQKGGASDIKEFFEKYKVLRNLTYTMRGSTANGGGQETKGKGNDK